MASDTTIRISAIDQTREAFRSVQSNISGLTGSLKSIAGPIAAAFSVAAIGAFAKSVIDTADALGDLSQSTGISVKELSALGNAAQLNGSSTEEFNQAIVKFQKSLAEAQGGINAQSDAFKTLGVSIKNADGSFKDTTTVFYNFADAMAVTEEGTVKTLLAQELLGRGSEKLIPTLNQGSEALKNFKATFDDDFVKKAGEFNDNLDKLGKNFDSLAATLLGPVVSGFNSFFDFIKRGSEREAIAGTFDMFTGELPTHMENTAKAATNIAAAMPKVARVMVNTAKAAQDQAKEIERLIALSKGYSDSIDRMAQKEATAQKGAEERAKRAASLQEMIRTPTEKYAQALREVNELQAEFRLTADEASLATEKLRDNFFGVQEGISVAGISIDDIGRNAFMTLENSILGLITGTTSLKESFKNMATSIINDLLRMYIRYMIVKPLFDAIFGAPSGPAAPISVARDIPGQRAIGGSVSRNTPYMVGERGPEMFIPNSSGSIVANDKMGGGSTNNVVVNVNMENGSVNATDGNRLGVLVGNIVKNELVKQTRPGGLLAA